MRERPRVRGNESETVYFETLCFLLRKFFSVWWPIGGLKWNRVLWTRFLGLQTEFNELGFWACKPSSLNSICKRRNWVHWTRFQGLQTESKELGLYAQKPSSLNSVCKPRNRVQRTRFHLSPPVNHQTLKKFLKTKHSVSKYTVSHSHSLSLSVSLSLSFQSQSLSHSHSLAPSPSSSLSRSIVSHSLSLRRRYCCSVSASLSLSPSVRTLFFLGLLACIDRFFLSLLQIPSIKQILYWIVLSKEVKELHKHSTYLCFVMNV